MALALVGAVLMVAIPAFQDYLSKSRTREGIDNVDRLVRGSALYISTPIVDDNGLSLVCRFPAAAPFTPASSCCGGPGVCASAADVWTSPTWTALDFALTDEHRFVYAYQAEGAGNTARFTAVASADLDCDGQSSLVSRSGFGRVIEGEEGACSLRLSPSFEIRDRFE